MRVYEVELWVRDRTTKDAIMHKKELEMGYYTHSQLVDMIDVLLEHPKNLDKLSITAREIEFCNSLSETVKTGDE